MPHCKQGSRKVLEQKFSGKRRNRRSRLTGEHLQPVARRSRFDDVILRSERDERSLFFLSVVFQQKRISVKAQRFFIPLRYIQNDNLAALGRDDGMGRERKRISVKAQRFFTFRIVRKIKYYILKIKRLKSLDFPLKQCQSHVYVLLSVIGAALQPAVFCNGFQAKAFPAFIICPCPIQKSA